MLEHCKKRIQNRAIVFVEIKNNIFFRTLC
jgi:hypothetical protein